MFLREVEFLRTALGNNTRSWLSLPPFLTNVRLSTHSINCAPASLQLGIQASNQ